ncbi:MAG: hypothetical protein IT178_19545 [Acidobacteria bacterium]|nr:hypothetical protein [Acidobacteriota bacterium]
MNTLRPHERFDAVDRLVSDEAATTARTQALHRPPISEEILDWIGFVRRHLLAMAVVWLLVLAAAVAVVFFVLPREYQSEAKFLVRTARQELVVGPGAATPPGASRGDVTEEVLNTEVELLRSRDILATVVEKLDLGSSYVNAGRTPVEASELALRDLSRGLVAGTIRKTNIVHVSYLSREPDVAGAVVQQVTDAYLAAHLVMHSSPGTYELYKTQAATAAEELRRAEEALAAKGRSANLLNLETQKKDALERINQIQTELDTIGAEMREHETKARVALVHMGSVPERVKTQMRNMPNQYSVERLHTLIVELNNKRTEILTKFNPDDRLVIELDQQIKDTNDALQRAQGLSANEESTDVNPAWQALESERIKARLALSGLESKSQALKRELAVHQQSALALTEAAPEYDGLLREVATARANYELYSRKEEEARIAGALDSERISNVVLAQAPVVSHVPAKPNKRLGVVAGAIAATVLALAFAFVRELFGFGARHRGDVRVAVFGVSAAPELP